MVLLTVFTSTFLAVANLLSHKLWLCYYVQFLNIKLRNVQVNPFLFTASKSASKHLWWTIDFAVDGTFKYSTINYYF